MTYFQVQRGDGMGFELLELKFKSPFPQCPQIWDPVNARFTQCSLPYISAIPAVASIFAIIVAFFQFLPGSLPWPRWTKPFVQEPLERSGRLAVRHKYYFRRPTYVLLVLSAIGLALQVVTGLYPSVRREMVFPTVSWAASFAILTVQHPVTTPSFLLVIYACIFATQSIILIDCDATRGLDQLPAVFGILTAFAAVVTILNMPMRNPTRPHDDIGPVFEPPTSEYRSPEDNLTLWQWMSVSWMAPLISLAKKRQMNDEDVWRLGYDFQHRFLHDNFTSLPGSVFKRLMVANGMDLVILSILSLIELVGLFSGPLLLQKILESMGNVHAPRWAALNYAILTLVIDLIQCQSAVFSLWYGRRAYERSRGELITMLYEKTLSRKVVSISSKPQEETLSNSDTENHAKRSMWMKPVDFVTNCFRSKRKSKKVNGDDLKTDEKARELATMGKIMNLMRFDAYEVSQRFWEFSYVVQEPVALVVSVVLIWRLLGWPCLIGVTTVIGAQIFNALLARGLLKWEKNRRVATDNKLHKVSQFVESIRHLRWYGWQDIWLDRIMDSRQKELYLRVIVSIWRMMINFMTEFGSGMFPVAAFYAYTIWAGKPLTVDVAFPALQLFSILEGNIQVLPTLITIFLNARIAMGRIEDFMSEPDKEKAEEDLISTGGIQIKNASFAWPGSTEPILKDITLSFSPGLTVVCGEVGAGKTALLQALLGEMDQLGGEYHRTSEMVGYCGQTPWLQSMTIRENILFSAPYDAARYNAVLEACALVPDMASFKHGDLSPVGENGIGLSGGQKARVSLARAIYSKAMILLLDDPLSALDHQTADYIVRKCLTGPLVRSRTTILVTHRVELCLGLADQAIEIKNGQSKLLDPETIPFIELHKARSSDSANESDSKNQEEKTTGVPEKFMEDEYRASGGVKAAVYWVYIKAGKLRWWGTLIVVLALFRIIDVAETWFLKQWGEAYGETDGHEKKGLFGKLPSPETNIRPWLIGFALLAASKAVAYLVSQGFMQVIVYTAGKGLFARAMKKYTHATFRFYDITPVGRLMNRLTSDVNTVDGDISSRFKDIAANSIAWISSIIVIASVTPPFLVFAILLTLLFVAIFAHFLPASQSLRRLEMVSLSPLISNFGELTSGLTTIRAYGASSRFQSRVIAVTDSFQKMDHFYWSAQTWLLYRFDSLSVVSTFLLTALALYTGVSAGLTAFVLTAAQKFVVTTHTLCRRYGQLQMDFVSVERVVELLDLEQEPPGSVEPPAYWPRIGSEIIFENVTIRYAPHLDPALSDINLTIKGGATTALIGRTGSGKSTLALSLLATTLPEHGRILVDGIDISTVSTQALRTRITFLAQEPVLFPGSMRLNLDPLSQHTDAECASVLSKITSDSYAWTLDTHIDTGGRNLSQGQRQLVGLARALLRRSPIVVMDEATASVDGETAGRVLDLVRRELVGSTVVVVAHRVEAVRGAEWCVQLGKGKVIQKGKANGMIEGAE